MAATMRTPISVWPEQPLRHEDEDDGEDREGGHVLVGQGEIAGEEGLDEADQQPADDCTGKRPDAAQHGSGEGLHAGDEPVLVGDHAILHQVHDTRHGGEACAHDEGGRDRAVDIDAEEGCHLAVLLAGTLGAAERRFLYDVPEDGEEYGRHQHNDDLLVGENHCEAVLAGGERDDRRGVEQGRNGLVARVLGDLDEVREHERHADG